MKIKLLGLAVASTLLAACGGEADDPTTRNWQIGEVYYSYPYQGQQAVSPKTPMIIRFSIENLRYYPFFPTIIRFFIRKYRIISGFLSGIIRFHFQDSG